MAQKLTIEQLLDKAAGHEQDIVIYRNQGDHRSAAHSRTLADSYLEEAVELDLATR